MNSSSPETVLAFDFGLRRIGVATGNTLLHTTQALCILAAKDGAPVWREVEQLIEEWQPSVLIVGNPLNMDDSDGALSARAHKFAQRLHGRFGLPVAMMDERLSSRAAQERREEAGLSVRDKEKPLDHEVAQLILQTWLEERAQS